MFHWSPDTITAVATYLKQGLSAAQIGAQLGISRNAVIGKVNRDEGLSAIGFANVNRKLSKHQAYEIKALLDQGMKQKDIAAIYRVSIPLVSCINTGRLHA